MIEIIEVTTKRQMKEFVSFPTRLYRDCEQYVPAFFGNEMRLLGDTNPSSGTAEAGFFLACRNGKTLGRIAGIALDAVAAPSHREFVRFSRFDTIDDVEVTRALMGAVERFGREKGRKKIHGPLGFNDFDHEGMLVEGFEHTTTFTNAYNADYYPRHLEQLGFEKEMDWLEFRLFPTRQNRDVLKRMEKISQVVRKRYQLHECAGTMSTAKMINRYGGQIFDLLNRCYAHLEGYIEIQPRVMEDLVASFKMGVDMDCVSLIADREDRLVACGLGLPSLAQALRACRGKLFPFGFIHILKAVRQADVLELAFIAVDDDYQMRGVNALVMERIMRGGLKRNFRYCETNQELETNANVQAQWKDFDMEQHKRRRCFVKSIQEPGICRRGP